MSESRPVAGGGAGIMKFNDLNSRQRSVMRYMFDTDHPAQSVTARGIDECQKLGLIHVGGCGEMTTTAKGEAMKPEIMPPPQSFKDANKASRERRKARKAKKGQSHE